jgi:mRNA interferase MazF
MRPIHLAGTDKLRPVLVLTREEVRPFLAWVTVAPITSTIRGLQTEVSVGPANGIDHESVIACDDVQTIRVTELGMHIGFLLAAQELSLTAALSAAFDLE